MTPNEIASRAAEAVLQTIERTKRINKGEIAEAIEKVLLVNQTTSVYSMLDRPAVDLPAAHAFILGYAGLCGND